MHSDPYCQKSITESLRFSPYQPSSNWSYETHQLVSSECQVFKKGQKRQSLGLGLEKKSCLHQWSIQITTEFTYSLNLTATDHRSTPVLSESKIRMHGLQHSNTHTNRLAHSPSSLALGTKHRSHLQSALRYFSTPIPSGIWHGTQVPSLLVADYKIALNPRPLPKLHLSPFHQKPGPEETQFSK